MTQWNIVWHYRDLRTFDNPALHAAASAGLTLPLYIHNPADEGAWAPGAASDWWLHHSLQKLDEDYKQLGSRLIIRQGSPAQVLEELTSELSIGAIYWNHRYEPLLQKRDAAVVSKMQKEGIATHLFEGNYLIEPSSLLNRTGGVYSVYTPFSKALLECSWRDPLPPPDRLPDNTLKSVGDLELRPKLNWAEGFRKHWRPGQEGAIQKLASFQGKADEYGALRDFPDQEATSRLSPHLHFGEISPHQIWKTVSDRAHQPLPFLKQLIWREFGNYFLFHNPTATDSSWRGQFEQFPWQGNQESLEIWQRGMTGYPIVDAGMRELWHTGWMHNRVRMIVASFLIKDLFVHWREGARWFWDTLVDADLANNTLGWQWVAGSGPDASPYFRIFNPILQGKKFDPDGAYVRRWVPELASLPTKWIHAPWESPATISGYPEPMVDHASARKQALEAYEQIKK